MRQSGWPQVAGVLAGAVLAVWFGGASAQQPQFGATVARVRVDVIVTDEDGDFVEDLTAGNFRLFEDGKRQEISSVQLVDLAGLRIVDLGGLRDGLGMEANHIKGSDALSRETGSPGDRPNSSRVPGAALTEEEIPSELIGDFGSVVFLIDMPNLTGRTKARFAARWVNWLERAEPPTLPWSIYILDTFNRLHQFDPANPGSRPHTADRRGNQEDANQQWLSQRPCFLRFSEPTVRGSGACLWHRQFLPAHRSYRDPMRC